MNKEDPSVPRADVHYPSFPQPSAPPMAQPVYHYSSESQYAPPQQQPLMQQPPPMAQTYVPPPYSGDYRQEGWCSMLFKLLLFHFMNSILGIVAFSVVVAGVSTSVGLLPLCCFGIVIFRVVLYAVRFFAQLDVQLFNYISPAEEHVYVSIPERAAFFGMEGQRLSPSLASVSPLSLMATLYFATIKFALGIASIIVLAFTVSFPIAELAAQFSEPDDQVYVNGIDVHDFNFETDPIGFTIATVCGFIIGFALMHIVARISRAATRFFCCERFSTYRYIQAPQYAMAPQYPVATSTYGTSGY